jgi:hypothetical protein
MPQIALEGDRDRIMAKAGALAGLSRRRALWCFGFQSDWPIARALRLWTPSPLWVLCFHSGTVIDTVTAKWEDELPSRFAHVLTLAL